jgi:hypothetical protein
MKLILNLVFFLFISTISYNQTLDFKFYDSDGREFSTATFNKEIISRDNIGLFKGIVLLETPSLNNSIYFQQNQILNLLDAESLQLIYITACLAEEYKDGYHTTVETANTLIKPGTGYRIRLLDNNAGVIFESDEVISKEIISQVFSSNQKFLADFLLKDELKPDNVFSQFKQFDFSVVFSHTENYRIFGIIGADHQRIKIKLTSIRKNPGNPGEYFVTGKSNVKDVICDFTGTITIKEIKEVKEFHYGVDNEYENKGIKAQGLLIANYEFNENPKQNHSGLFQGILYSDFYLNADHQIQYDDIQSNSDENMNNAFIGTWTSYSTGEEKLCIWADYRVPLANQDFDIGAGEFSPGEKYYEKGWEIYQQAWLYGNKEAMEEELKEWWK